MAEPEILTPQEQEDLVAYLDGELEEEAARRLEAKLTHNPAARQEAEVLQRTWELLDYLPSAKTAQDFTRRTLGRLPMIAKLRRKPWLLGSAWAASLVLAAGLSFSVAFFWPQSELPEPSRDEIRLLEQRHLYQKIDNIDFLRALDRPDLFGEES